ncbi:hypothetical protein L2E82_44606 [Cichorium intybus]|uniref:Uncharacterized protein n=1 Tax=Cichorium intybus TaxID=13427 RepID=A0ACB8ZQL2_CICIN|nr:hypothetical protein L2E82_44606 [Cichorium intybus]
MKSREEISGSCFFLILPGLRKEISRTPSELNRNHKKIDVFEFTIIFLSRFVRDTLLQLVWVWIFSPVNVLEVVGRRVVVETTPIVRKSDLGSLSRKNAMPAALNKEQRFQER